MAHALTSVYVKKKLMVRYFTPSQQNMLKVGTVGLATVKNRVQKALDADDKAAPPLNKRYAITKSRLWHKRAIRDLTFTGDMMRNLQVREVTYNTAKANLSTRKDRGKGRAHAGFFAKRTGSSWLAFSPTNTTDTIRAAFEIFGEQFRRQIGS